MLKAKLDRKIDRRLDGLRESLQYLHESVADIMSEVSVISNLIYLKDSLEKEENKA